MEEDGSSARNLSPKYSVKSAFRPAALLALVAFCVGEGTSCAAMAGLIASLLDVVTVDDVSEAMHSF